VVGGAPLKLDALGPVVVNHVRGAPRGHCAAPRGALCREPLWVIVGCTSSDSAAPLYQQDGTLARIANWHDMDDREQVGPDSAAVSQGCCCRLAPPLPPPPAAACRRRRCCMRQCNAGAGLSARGRGHAGGDGAADFEAKQAAAGVDEGRAAIMPHPFLFYIRSCYGDSK
jgi:hypothetical protein